MQNKVELTSMVTVLNRVRKDGFTTDFRVTEDGLCALATNETFKPEQLQIVNFYRFEGETNPDDMAILYVVETNTGLKGTISDAYGLYSDETIESFMKQVQDLGKNLDRSGR